MAQINVDSKKCFIIINVDMKSAIQYNIEYA